MGGVTCPQCRHSQERARVCAQCGAEIVRATLEGLGGGLLGHSFPVNAVPFTIGRAPENELCLADPSVSRQHARIVWEEGGFVVEDLGSRYGVFVDGARVRRAALARGTRIQIGDAVLQFHLIEPDVPRDDVTYSLNKAERRDLLLAVIEAVSSTLVLGEVLEQIVDAVVRITRAERGFLLLVPEPGMAPGPEVAGLRLRVARSARGEAPGVGAIAPDVVEKVATSRLPVLTRIDHQSTTTQDVGKGAALTTIVCLPLLETQAEAGGPLVGVIYADNPSVWTTLDSDSLRAAEALCRHAALAIHNARLFEREQRARGEAQRARDQALAASRAKSTFLAVMSHELHTPLNAIIGYGEMCQERAQERGDGEDRADLARLLDAARHLLRLVDDVLDASELESGGLRLSPEPVEIAPLLKEVAAATEPIARQNNDIIDLAVAEGLGVILVDRRRLRQVITSLTSNAARFTQGGRVRIAARRDQKGELVVEVADNGPGMSDEQLSRVIQPFTQADDSSTRRHGGLGLGLSIARKLCEAMGGELRLDSALGRGCTATVRLPSGGRQP